MAMQSGFHGARGLFYASIGALLLSTLHPAAARASWWPFGDDSMDYEIRFDGADAAMKKWFTKLHLNEPTDTNPPQNLDELEQEANGLAAKVKRALEAKGYMEAVAEPSLDKTAEPPVVHITVEQGHRYTLRAITFDWKEDKLRDIDPALIKSKQGAPLDMKAIEADAITLLDTIGKDACLLSLNVSPRLRLYSASRDAELVFTIEHGPKANFGAPTIAGNTKVKDKVINRTVAWKEGECFDAAKVERTRSALIQNQLFSTVTVEPAPAPDASGQVPMAITVKERVARTVGVGTEYSTDEGIGVYGSWEHRNLFGGAEKFVSGLTIAQRKQGINASVRVPAFMRDNQVLALATGLKREDTDAYEALTFDGSAGLERRLSKRLNGGLGIGYTLSSTRDELTGTNQYALLSFPGFVEYDSRDDPIDAREGLFARGAITPYTETVGDGGQFIKMLATGQSYLSSDTIMLKPTLATRVSIGSISGGKGDDVPADIRFYAGGGGSVRGYSYQSISPQVGGTPIGGSSLIEASAELRMRFTSEFGGVIFTDAGNVTNSSMPDFGEKLYYGAGVGARYYSPIGPLRADVAFPLNGDDIGEDGYQFYVSLGQAF